MISQTYTHTQDIYVGITNDADFESKTNIYPKNIYVEKAKKNESKNIRKKGNST